MRFPARLLCCLAFLISSLAGVSADGIDNIIGIYARSVPKIRCTNNGSSFSLGSGAYIGKGWVLTCKHVTEGSARITCEFAGQSIPVTEHISSRNTDQTLCRLARDPGVQPITIVQQAEASVLYGAGYDHGRRLRFWSGRPTGTQWNSGNRNFYGEGGAVQGNSGGPVFSDYGMVGNLWGTSNGSCFYTSNSQTLDFIRRASVRYPDLADLLPGNQGSQRIQQPQSPQTPLQPISYNPGCVDGNCQPAPQPSQPLPPPQQQPLVGQQQQPRSAPSPQVNPNPNPNPNPNLSPKGIGEFSATVRPRFSPELIFENGSMDVPISVPLKIRIKFAPEVQYGASR